MDGTTINERNKGMLTMDQLQAVDELTAAYKTLKRLSDSEDESRSARAVFGVAAAVLFESMNAVAHHPREGSPVALETLHRILDR